MGLGSHWLSTARPSPAAHNREGKANILYPARSYLPPFVQSRLPVQQEQRG